MLFMRLNEASFKRGIEKNNHLVANILQTNQLERRTLSKKINSNVKL